MLLGAVSMIDYSAVIEANLGALDDGVDTRGIGRGAKPITGILSSAGPSSLQLARTVRGYLCGKSKPPARSEALGVWRRCVMLCCGVAWRGRAEERMRRRPRRVRGRREPFRGESQSDLADCDELERKKWPTVFQ